MASTQHNLGRNSTRCPSRCRLSELQTSDYAHSLGLCHSGCANGRGKVRIRNFRIPDNLKTRPRRHFKSPVQSIFSCARVRNNVVSIEEDIRLTMWVSAYSIRSGEATFRMIHCILWRDIKVNPVLHSGGLAKISNLLLVDWSIWSRLDSWWLVERLTIVWFADCVNPGACVAAEQALLYCCWVMENQTPLW